MSDVSQTRRKIPRPLKRAGATAFLLATLAAAYWGYTAQEPGDPFTSRAWWERLLAPLPHPNYAIMPVKPLGVRPAFVPRELDLDPRTIAPSGGTAQSRRFFATRLAVTPGVSTIAAVGADGRVLLSSDTKTWSLADLPRPVAKASGSFAEIAVLRGHEGPVNSVAFSPGGARLATGSDDGTARLWDTAKGAETAVLQGHKGGVLSVAFSPDGTRLATGSLDNTARLWDTATGAEINVLRGHEEAVLSVAFSPGGTRLATGSVDGTARLWDTAKGTETAVLRGHEGPVSSVAFSPDGARLATGSLDNTARLWDTAKGAEINVLRGHESPVNSVVFSPDGTRLATGSGDGTARLWDTAKGAEINVLRGHESLVSSMAFSPDGARLATGSADNTARLWDTAKGAEIAVLQGHEDTVSSVAFSPDGTRLATGSRDVTARLWDIASVETSTVASPPPVARGAAVVTEDTVWVVGLRGYVARLQGGKAEAFASGIETDLFAVYVVDDKRVRVAGAKGVILASEDGGTTWQRQATGIETAIHALVFRASGQGWAAGDDGLILHHAGSDKTGEGAWEELTDVGDARLSALHVQDNGIAWAAGGGALGPVTIFEAASVDKGDSWRALPHYTAPWLFLIGLPAFVFAGFVNLRVWRPEPPPPVNTIVGAAASDDPMGLSGQDALNLKPIAFGLSRFLRNRDSAPPITIAVGGRWGTGKSSLMNMLKEDLQQHDCRPVWFNAWHHSQEKQLLAALMENVRAQALPSWWTGSGLHFRARLFWLRARKDAIGLLALMALFAVAAGIVKSVVPEDDLAAAINVMATWAEKDGKDLLSNSVPDFLEDSLGAGNTGLLGLSVTAFAGLALWLRRRLVALSGNPAKLLSRLARNASVGDFKDSLGFRYRFGREFSDTCRALRFGDSPGLVVFIDDLDRCLPKDVLDVLEAVNYFVSVGPCFVILGMDPRQVEHCVGVGFADVVEGLPDDELKLETGEDMNGLEEGEKKAARQRAFARHYLEKLVNIEVLVPSLKQDQALAMLGAQVGQPGAAGQETDWTPPAWMNLLRRSVHKSYDIARFGMVSVILALIGMAAVSTIAVNKGEDPPSTKIARPSAASATASSTSLARPSEIQSEQDTAGEELEVRQTSRKEGGFQMPEIKPIGEGDRAEPWRWLWWGPTALAGVIVLLWGIGAALRSHLQSERDSPAFKTALRIVNPLVFAAHGTPRAIKRFQNRTRYLAVRVNPPPRSVDPLERLLYNLGVWLKYMDMLEKPLVPKEYVEPAAKTVLSEPKLILLCAAEAFNMKLQDASPKEFHSWLVGITDKSKSSDEQQNWFAEQYGSQERYNKWAEIRKSFKEDNICGDHWPSENDIRLYRGMIASVEPKMEQQDKNLAAE